MTIKRILSLFTVLVLAALVFGYGYYQHVLNLPLKINAQNNIIEIQKGDTLYKVLADLTKSGVLPEEVMWSAKVYLKEQSYQGNELAKNVKAGEFKLESDLDIPSLLALLTSNKQIQYSLTLVEGTSFKQVMQTLANTPKLNVELKGKTPKEVMDSLQIHNDFNTFHPEGLFYPDTYRFQKGDTDTSILQRAHIRLVQILYEEWVKREKGLPFKEAYEALILASIVEKETGVPSERDQIAGVFVRRLQKKMRLQTDPTVIYGLGERYKGNITRKHLKELTPYNTYRISGLPPTPIALAGREAIHATLNPAKGDDLYFVAKGDGSHQFSANISDHNKAVREYQLKRRKDYRSTPKAAN